MPLTTVSLKPGTLTALRAYKVGGASFDDVINELMDEHPPAAFIREHLRRLREEERYDWKSVKRELNL